MLEETREKSAWQQGWREVGNQRVYFRSRWEANYGRYLELMVRIGNIVSWEHEPQTFWFPIRRGKVSYLPDFRVTLHDGSHEWHEVKGYMDPGSRTKLKRMAKYHPGEILRLIDERAYREIEFKFSDRCPGWEGEKDAPTTETDKRIRRAASGRKAARAAPQLERRLR